MSDPHPPRPDQPSWITPSQPVHVPTPAAVRPGKTPALMAAAFLVAGLVFVLGLPAVGRIGGPKTSVHLSLPVRKVDRARFPTAATSPQLSLQVNVVDTSSNCRTNTADGEGVYLSNCTDWERAGYHAEIFKVALVNNSDHSVAWSLDQFQVHSADGPDVPALPASASDGLSQSGTLSPHDFTQGYVAFETGDEYVPESLSYSDEEILVVDVSAP